MVNAITNYQCSKCYTNFETEDCAEECCKDIIIKEDIENKIRIDVRSHCKPINTDKGMSENEIETLAIYYFNKGKESVMR